MKRLVKSAEQAWRMDLETLFECSLSEIEEKPDFTDCNVEMWWTHDCGDIVMFFRNTETNYYWKHWCTDWYGFFGNVQLAFDVTTSENLPTDFKKKFLNFILKAESEDFKHCDIEDTPFTIEDFYDLSNNTDYVESLTFEDEYEEIDEKELATIQYKELLGIIEGKSYGDIMNMDMNGILRCCDDTEDFGCFGYIYYKNCRFQIYEDTDSHDLLLDHYNIDVYSDDAYYCDGDCVENVVCNIGEAYIVTPHVNPIVISQESMDNFKKECEVALKDEESGLDIFYKSMKYVFDNQRTILIESIKYKVRKGMKIDWDGYDFISFAGMGNFCMECHEFSDLKIAEEFLAKERNCLDDINVGDVYLYDSVNEENINITLFSIEALLSIYANLL